MIHVNNDTCTLCMKCVTVCPAIVMARDGEDIVFTSEEACIECYQCVAVCPSDSLTCDEFPLDDFAIIEETSPVSAEAMRRLLTQRRSVRTFRKREVPRDLLKELVMIASHAPTGRNEKGVRLTVVNNRRKINAIDSRIFNTFDAITGVFDNQFTRNLVRGVGGEQASEFLEGSIDSIARFKEAGLDNRRMILRGAPVLMVAHVAPGASLGRDDCIIALSHVMMAANAAGLGATWIGLLVMAAKADPVIKSKLRIPFLNTIHSAIILGWPKYEYKRVVPRKMVPVKWIV